MATHSSFRTLRSAFPLLPGHLPVWSTALLLGVSGCQPPSTRTPEGKADGARVYAVYCQGCHGPDGARGTPSGQLTGAAQRPREELRRVIEKGRRAMPAWEKRLAPDEISAVIDHIRTFGSQQPAPGAG